MQSKVLTKENGKILSPPNLKFAKMHFLMLRRKPTCLKFEGVAFVEFVGNPSD